MGRPVVSILIPVYNRARMLRSCVESALAQTLEDLEVVVVDNASRDGTWAACESLAARDRRIRVFRNERNLGPVRNWKRCIDLARGEYGKLLYSDDLIAPRFLEATIGWLRNSPEVGFAFTAVEVGPEPGKGKLSYCFAAQSGCCPSEEFVEAALLVGGRTPVSPGAGLFRIDDMRSSLVTQVPGKTDWMSTGAGPDVLLYLLTAARYEKIAFVAEPLAFFRKHDACITVARRAEVADGYRQAYVSFAEHHVESAWVRNRVAARVWLEVMRWKRRPMSPTRVLRSYGSSMRVGLLFWPATFFECAAGALRLLKRSLRFGGRTTVF